jgi:site-specific recombinase XerD
MRPILAESKLDLILQKISKLELPGAEHWESYMKHKWRMNHKSSTLKGSFHAVRSFLTFYVSSGKNHLQEIVNDDLEAFVEHEQDRGLKVTTVRTRLKHIWAFLRFLSERDIIGESILKRKIRLRVPDFLPRAIAPGDVRRLIGGLSIASHLSAVPRESFSIWADILTESPSAITVS